MKTHQAHLLATFSLVGLLLLMGCGEANISSALEEETSAVSISAAKTSSSGMACVPPPSGMVSWWPGDGNAQDIVGQNDGTLLNGATFAPGKVGQAFSLDGADDHILVPYDQSLNLGLNEELTIDTWMRPDDLGRNQSIISSWKGFEGSCGGLAVGYELKITQARFHILLRNNNHLGGGVNYCDVFSTTVVQVGQWYHVAAELSSSPNAFCKLFVNGVEEGQVLIPTPTDYVQPEPLYIGAHFNYCDGLLEFFDGLIDEVEIYDRALTAEEIEDIYNAGSAGKCKTTEVEIDIKPGSDPNSINPKSKGVIPVAILTTASFDATTVDPLTVTFGPDGATESHGRGHVEDVDSDGDDDLMLHFRTQETGIARSDTQACLTGETTSGDTVHGCDAIVTVGK